MDELNQKISMTSFLAIGGIFAFVLAILLDILASQSGWFARQWDHDLIRHGVPVFSGFALFLALQMNPRVRAWTDEVIHEIRKVSWPTRQQTLAATVYVCFFVLISGAALGAFDLVSAYLINKILQ